MAYKSMTLQDIINEIPDLTVQERKSLVNVIMDSLAEPTLPEIQERTPGLHRGSTWISGDFDELSSFID